MAKKEYIVEEVQKLMENVEQVRNVAIVAHVDHGKTTLVDSLVARAGLINKDLAGEQRVMDFDEQEQKRGITIKSANISLGFSFEGKDYVINLIDTPGHVDFGGHVTRALRAVDGVVVVVDAVEGVMPQTEAVLRQALKERAKPTVFINKVDRLINELQLTPEEMQQRFVKIITSVNKLIEANAPKEFVKDWLIAVSKGNVAFGSAFHKWALSITSMKRFNITFKDVYNYLKEGKQKELSEKSPVDEVLLEMVITHLPSPRQAQKYRLSVLWHGDLNSDIGKAMQACDPNAPMVGVCFGVVYDSHAGEVAVLRLFSGKVEKGDELYVISQKKKYRVQQVGIYMGPDRVSAGKVVAGNIAAVVGLKDVMIGDTVSSLPDVEPFEQIKHYSEPVITKSIEAKDSKDLAKLIEVLRAIKKEDPTIKIELNQETGEHLISGMGELHLEIIEYKIKNEHKIPIITSPPIVVYRETVTKRSPEVEGKSPNKHNRLKFYVEPLSEELKQSIAEGEVPEGRPKGKELVDVLVKYGMSRDEAKNVWDIYNGNVFVNDTRGIQYLNEVKELILQGFEEAMDAGPLAKEKVSGVKVVLTDATLHEDNVHRGPSQMLPTVKRPIYAAILMADPILLEPKQKVTINVPQDYSGNVITLIQGKRGQLLNMEHDNDYVNIVVKMPVSEMFGFASELRSATQGKAIPYQEYAGYEPLPKELMKEVVLEIRKRKGEKEEIPTPEFFMS